jgi:hypothetical protein
MAATKIGTIMICVKCQKQIKRNYHGYSGSPMCFSCVKEKIRQNEENFYKFR